MPQAIVAKKPVATHPDMCIESLPRRPQVVTFDNALLALKLAPGARGKGAVLDGWTDPIGAHDQKVIEVEQAMLQEKELVSGNFVITAAACTSRHETALMILGLQQRCEGVLDVVMPRLLRRLTFLSPILDFRVRQNPAGYPPMQLRER